MVFELVSGPPASGKKEYISQKISENLNDSAYPEEILVITNSEQAADDFKSNILNEIEYCSDLWCSTIASFCKKILRENYHLTELRPGFEVISDFEKKLIVRNILNKNIGVKVLKYSGLSEGMVREVSNFLDISKRNPGWEKNIDNSTKQQRLKYKDLRQLSRIYENTLRKYNYVDFVDLTLYTRKLLEEHPEIINFKKLFAYEVEDMDQIMGDIIMSLVKKTEEGVISLSPDIDIYRFRGSRPRDIKNNLTNNFNLKEVELKPENKQTKTFYIESDSRDEQAKNIASHIGAKIKQGINPREIGVISRSSGESIMIFCEALRRRGINNIVVGGTGLFKQFQIVRLFSLLNCINKKEDAEDTDLYRGLLVMNIMDENEIDMLRRESVISSKSLREIFKTCAPKKFAEYENKIKQLNEKSKRIPLDTFIYDVMTEFNFFKQALNNKYIAELFSSFFRIISSFTLHYKNIHHKEPYFNEFMENIYDFLTSFGKNVDLPFDPDKQAVRIMTVQQSKGKTFKYAYLTDMNDDVFPRSYRENPLLSDNDFRNLDLKPYPGVEKQYEFEKRLFQVAKSRGEKEVFYCWYNTKNDNTPIEVSPFVNLESTSVINYKVENPMIDEKDILMDFVEKTPVKIIKKVSENIKSGLKNRLKDIAGTIELKRKNLHDYPVSNIPDEFSYSSLENYVKCPWYFFINNIIKIKMPFTVHQTLGIAVHKTLQYYYQNKEKNIRKILESTWQELDFSSDFDRRNLFITALNLLNSYIQAVKGKEINVNSVEQEFSIKHSGVKLKGRIDRIDTLGTGEKRVVDYKTGKKTKGSRALLNAVKRGENFQIPIYKWAVEPGYFTIYWLRKKPERMQVDIDFNDDKMRKAVAETEENISKIVERIKKESFMPEKSGKCRNCYFDRICTR
ncbi:MAG: PD-(D/E)XK nuclease family protein [Elusimicrobiota bacterium]